MSRMRRACCSLAFDSHSEVSRQLCAFRAGASAPAATSPLEQAPSSRRKQMLVPESIDRRYFLTAAGLGTVAALAMPGLAAGADWSDAEKANVKVVNDMCASWS